MLLLNSSRNSEWNTNWKTHKVTVSQCQGRFLWYIMHETSTFCCAHQRSLCADNCAGLERLHLHACWADRETVLVVHRRRDFNSKQYIRGGMPVPVWRLQILGRDQPARDCNDARACAVVATDESRPATSIHDYRDSVWWLRWSRFPKSSCLEIKR